MSRRAAMFPNRRRNISGPNASECQPLPAERLHAIWLNLSDDERYPFILSLSTEAFERLLSHQQQLHGRNRRPRVDVS